VIAGEVCRYAGYAHRLIQAAGIQARKRKKKWDKTRPARIHYGVTQLKPDGTIIDELQVSPELTVLSTVSRDIRIDLR